MCNTSIINSTTHHHITSIITPNISNISSTLWFILLKMRISLRRTDKMKKYPLTRRYFLGTVFRYHATTCCYCSFCWTRRGKITYWHGRTCHCWLTYWGMGIPITLGILRLVIPHLGMAKWNVPTEGIVEGDRNDNLKALYWLQAIYWDSPVGNVFKYM